jgi:hypothetical protein
MANHMLGIDRSRNQHYGTAGWPSLHRPAADTQHICEAPGSSALSVCLDHYHSHHNMFLVTCIALHCAETSGTTRSAKHTRSSKQ